MQHRFSKDEASEASQKSTRNTGKGGFVRREHMSEFQLEPGQGDLVEVRSFDDPSTKERIRRFVLVYYAIHRVCPTVDDILIGLKMGMGFGTIHRLLVELEDDGELVRVSERRTARNRVPAHPLPTVTATLHIK